MRRSHPMCGRTWTPTWLLGVLAATSPAHAAPLQVPAEYATIGAALVAAGPGDDVVVAPGTYSPSTNGESFPLSLTTSGVQLLASGPGVVLDAEQTAGVVQIDVAGSVRVSGFTITGGVANRGGGVSVLGGDPEIDHNVVVDNGAVFRGAGVFALGTAAPWVHHNVVWSNFDADSGDLVDPHGVVLQEEATGIVEHNLIGRTDGNGLLTSLSAQPVVRHNIFLENGQPDPIRGRGICWLASTPAIVTHNLFHANTVAAILWTAGGGDFSGAEANDVDANDDVYGNLDGDPALADPDAGDFHLTPGSPAIDAGDPLLGTDPDGTVLDLGPFFLDQNALAAPASSPGSPMRAYPNPFRARTTIAFDRDRSAGTVRIDILDVAGRRLRTLRVGPSDRDASWDGRDESGRPVATGVYWARAIDGTSAAAAVVPLIRIR